jgi:hypothetical protein
VKFRTLGRATNRSPREDRSPQEEGLAVVDSALSLARQRRVFTTAEALDVLDGVQKKVSDPRVRALVARKVAAATDAFAGTAPIDGSRLIDQLLDLRSAISGCTSDTDPARVGAPTT